MQHEQYIRRCLQLAQRGKGSVAPNPMVGAVLVHNGSIIAEGWHKQYGGPHAEVDCLNNVADEDKHLIPDSIMYVNLEPCAHHGKTPPCASRLVQEKIKQVVIGNADPFEHVNGKGIDILKRNGMHVKWDVLQEEGLWVNRRFFCFHQQRRPYIILKWAQTKEGYFAPLDRSRFQISNRHSQQIVHKWRAEETAIMVGYQTAMNDNPQLTSRLWQGKQPLRIVLDPELSLPATANVFAKDADTWIINNKEENEDGHVRYIKLSFDETFLPSLLQRMHQANILSLIVEGGAMLLQSFIEAGLWNEARVLTGSGALPLGIPAPLLTRAVPAFSAPLEGDVLNVYVHQNSPYQYVQGMEL